MPDPLDPLIFYIFSPSVISPSYDILFTPFGLSPQQLSMNFLSVVFFASAILQNAAFEEGKPEPIRVS